MKDAPSVSPVSYPSRVAPLPEDRTREVAEEYDELRREGRRIESDGRVRSYFGPQEEEEEKIPFPTFIKLEKGSRKLPMDLTTAIREVKVSIFLLPSIVPPPYHTDDGTFFLLSSMFDTAFIYK